MLFLLLVLVLVLVFSTCLAFFQPLHTISSYLKSSTSKLLFQRRANTNQITLQIDKTTENSTPPHAPIPTNLPREIREQIATYLSLNDILSLKLSCRHLYHTGPALGVLFYQIRKDPHLRFERLCMAERDEESRSHKRARSIICSSCKMAHPTKMFLQREMEKGAEHRRCLGQEGRLYITPDYCISFPDLVSMLSKIQPFQSYTHHALPMASIYNRQPGHQAQGPNGLPYSTSDLRLQRRSKDNVDLSYKWGYTNFGLESGGVMKSEYDAEQYIKHRFEKPVLKFCPHFSSSDLGKVPDGQLSGHHHYCSECATWVSVAILNCEGAIVVSIGVSRKLGNGRSATDKHWISQLEF